MFEKFFNKNEKKPYPKPGGTEAKGYIEFIIHSTMDSDYYTTTKNEIDVRRIEAWFCSLFQYYFEPKYREIINFSLEYSSGCVQDVTIRYNMTSKDSKYLGVNRENKRESVIDFANNVIDFIKYVNREKKKDGEPYIIGAHYKFCGFNEQYSEAEGQNESRLLP